MSEKAKIAIAQLTVLFLMGRPHSTICDCPACRAWEKCDELIQPKVLAELDEISGRKSEPIKTL